jgi:hypothetical protein
MNEIPEKEAIPNKKLEKQKLQEHKSRQEKPIMVTAA